jgi:hypothetical protein
MPRRLGLQARCAASAAAKASGAEANGGEERVPGGLEDAASAGFDRLPQSHVVPGEGEVHLFRVFLPELGAALDIGEEKGDQPRRRRGDDSSGNVTSVLRRGRRSPVRVVFAGRKGYPAPAAAANPLAA